MEKKAIAKGIIQVAWFVGGNMVAYAKDKFRHAVGWLTVRPIDMAQVERLRRESDEHAKAHPSWRIQC